MKSDGAACLVSEDEGWRHMQDYDDLPPVVRKLLRESKYNICAACFYKEYYKVLSFNGEFDPQAEYRAAQEVIRIIEYRIDRQTSRKYTISVDRRRVTIEWQPRPEYGV